MPAISDIPTASQLQSQLETLRKSIETLDMAGTTVPYVTVMPGPSNDPSVPFVMAISLVLDPPISSATTLATLKTALESRASDVSLQLQNMGYQDDTTPPAPPPIPPG
jgi:hypothetical protein